MRGALRALTSLLLMGAAAASVAAGPPKTSGQMQREALAAAQRGPLVRHSPRVTARRCGWLSNPTPGNWELFDRDGEWLLGAQGGFQAPGLDEIPDMTTAGWKSRNRSYGYGCACLTLTVDSASREVLRIANARPRPLKQCSADRALPRP
jgi:hypothetical protein